MSINSTVFTIYSKFSVTVFLDGGLRPHGTLAFKQYGHMKEAVSELLRHCTAGGRVRVDYITDKTCIVGEIDTVWRENRGEMAFASSGGVFYPIEAGRYVKGRVRKLVRSQTAEPRWRVVTYHEHLNMWKKEVAESIERNVQVRDLQGAIDLARFLYSADGVQRCIQTTERYIYEGKTCPEWYTTHRVNGGGLFFYYRNAGSSFWTEAETDGACKLCGDYR